MRQTTTSPNLPLDPVMTTPRSRAAAPKTREPFLIPEHRPEAPGARRALPARPEASSFDQARAESRSTERAERREPTRGQRPDKPCGADRPSDAAPRASRSEPSRDGHPLRESGNETCDKVAKCPEESVAKAAPEATPTIETASEEANSRASEFAELEVDEAGPTAPEITEQAETESYPEGQQAVPTPEAQARSLVTTGPAPAASPHVQAGSSSEAASPETETSLQAALGAAGEGPARGKPDSGGTSPHPVGPPAEPSPEPGSGPSHSGARPEGLSSQALTQAADAAQDRGIQTALIATSSPGAAADSTRVSPNVAPAIEKPHPVTQPMPLGAVPIEIGLKSLAGLNRFEIRLDPAELGRIDVQLEIGDDGEVKAHLTVDRVETLALLQRDARTLERAFEQAGLKSSEGGIDLTLRDQAGDPEGRGARDGRRDDSIATAGRDGMDQHTENQNAAAAAPRPFHWRNGIDVRV